MIAERLEYPDLQRQAESALSAFQPRKVMPSSFLLSTTKVGYFSYTSMQGISTFHIPYMMVTPLRCHAPGN
eukprot:1161895-Pelagomonas_calceolata.AAC.9